MGGHRKIGKLRWSAPYTIREIGVNGLTSGASLLSFPGKVYAKCLEKRCREIIEPQLEDTQCRFRAGHSTADQFSTLQKIFEKSSECGKDFYSCFVDLLKVYHYATKNFLCRGWDVFWIIFGRWIRIWRLVSPAVRIFQDIYNIIYIFL